MGTMTDVTAPSTSVWQPGRLVSRENLPALTLLVVCLLVAGLGWFALSEDAKRHTQGRFELQVADVLDGVKARLQQHEQILLGGAGLFDASNKVDRAEWRTYVSRLRLAENYPGILGVGFSKLIRPEELAAHITDLRAEGFPYYDVYPPGDRPIYTSIIFLEPFSGRNLAAFGYDMMSESTRADAMRRAAESGRTAISSKVKLVQENHGKVQAGFLMYVPVYRKNMPLTTPTERMRALEGFSYSPYRVDDLMAGIMNGRKTEIDFQIFDGDSVTDSAKMYDHIVGADTAGEPLVHSARHTIHAYGHSWTVLLCSRPEFEALYASRLPVVVLVMGGGIGVLLFLLVSAATVQRNRAQALARQMTVESRAQATQLKVSEERFDLALRGSNDGIWDWDILTNEVYYSPRMHEQLGVAPGALGNAFASFEQRLHPDDLDRTMAAINAHLETNALFDVEYRLSVATGATREWRWFNARGMAVRGAKGIPVRMAGSLTDVTEKHRVEQMKSDFVSTVSHELRTPVTSIHGVLGLAVGGALGELPQRLEAMLRTAYKNSVRLTLLIDDLLDMEKLVAGKMRFDFRVHALMPLIDQAVEATHAYAAQLKVSLRVTDRADVFVRVDGHRLEQVLSNFLSNAAKFSPEGSHVQVSVQIRDKKVRVSVIDQGRGIPEKFRARIFQKFSQADNSDARTRGGTGLGLAISQDLIERMHGQIGFTSEVEVGSCFYFEFLQSAVAPSELSLVSATAMES